jgi:hypothetical protein
VLEALALDFERLSGKRLIFSFGSRARSWNGPWPERLWGSCLLRLDQIALTEILKPKIVYCAGGPTGLLLTSDRRCLRGIQPKMLPHGPNPAAISFCK